MPISKKPRRRNSNLQLQAEKDLRDSEQNFRSLVELSPDGIGIEHDGIVVFINSAGAKIFGAESPGQIIGKQVIELVHHDYREAVRERMSKVTSHGNISPVPRAAVSPFGR